MNLHFLSDNTCYLDGGINLGLLVKEQKTGSSHALLIDAGIEAAVAKRVVKLLSEQNISLKGLILTHSHADHMGGAAYLRNTLKIPVMAASLEKPLIENPWLEPFYLFGGAKPLKSMENKFLQAPPCPVDISLETGKQEVLGFNLEIIGLPGHSAGQIGISYEETLYVADALLAPEILAKHGLPYNVDVAQVFNSLEYIKTSSFSWYVPCHGPVVQDPIDLAVANRIYLDNLLELLLENLDIPRAAPNLLSLIINKKALTVTNPGQYYLLQASLQGLLCYLLDQESLKLNFPGNEPLWSRR